MKCGQFGVHFLYVKCFMPRIIYSFIMIKSVFLLYLVNIMVIMRSNHICKIKPQLCIVEYSFVCSIILDID